MQVSVWRELCSTVRYSVAEVCCLGSVCVVCELYVAVVCSVEEVDSLVCPVVSCVMKRQVVPSVSGCTESGEAVQPRRAVRGEQTLEVQLALSTVTVHLLHGQIGGDHWVVGGG